MNRKEIQAFFDKVKNRKLRLNSWKENEFFIPRTLQVLPNKSAMMIGETLNVNEEGVQQTILSFHYVENSWQIIDERNYGTEDKLSNDDFDDDKVYQKVNLFLKVSTIKKLKEIGNVKETIENIVEEYLEE